MKRGEYLLKIIEEKGYTVMSLSKASGVAYTTIRSMIERDLAGASIDNLLLIGKVLGVSSDELVDPAGWMEKKAAPYYALNSKDERDIAIELEHMLADLESDKSLAFSGEPMDDETKRLFAISLENSLRYAREMAKKKFTPKKHRE